MNEQSRRAFLAGIGGAGTVAVAGCIGGGGDGSDEEPTETPEVEEARQLGGETLRSYFPVKLFEPDTDNRVAEVHYHTDFSHWHFVAFEVPLDGYRAVEARVYNDDDEVIPLGEDEQFHLEITRTEGTPADMLEVEVLGSTLNFHGTNADKGELLFHLSNGDERVWTTPPLTTVVGDPPEE
ncbi:hypothetical protein [Halovenus salina]|uniref:hypothetical protein n=1 Tax=Halovenus salina TaxID=1510225 RepID=UPI002260951F|nr:hypothetical protein [Halovenus salina]